MQHELEANVNWNMKKQKISQKPPELLNDRRVFIIINNREKNHLVTLKGTIVALHVISNVLMAIPNEFF